MKIKCAKCGYEKIITDMWFDPDDFSNTYYDWEQEYKCFKCGAINIVSCEYNIDYEITDVEVAEELEKK